MAACFNNDSKINIVMSGGQNNKAAGQLNGILGGLNNNDNGLNGVMIVGNNITAVNNNALHIEGLWANGIPDATTGPYPSGTVVFVPVGTIPPGYIAQGSLWIV